MWAWRERPIAAEREEFCRRGLVVRAWSREVTRLCGPGDTVNYGVMTVVPDELLLDIEHVFGKSGVRAYLKRVRDRLIEIVGGDERIYYSRQELASFRELDYRGVAPPPDPFGVATG